VEFHSLHKIFTLFSSYLWILVVNFFIASLNEALYNFLFFGMIVNGAVIVFFELLNGLGIIKMIEIRRSELVALEEFYKFLSQHMDYLYEIGKFKMN
jgi:hypothetical protein